MQVVMISEERLEELFDKALKEAELVKWERQGNRPDPKFHTKADIKQFISDVHRRLHYHVVVLKENIKKAGL